MLPPQWKSLLREVVEQNKNLVHFRKAIAVLKKEGLIAEDEIADEMPSFYTDHIAASTSTR